MTAVSGQQNGASKPPAAACRGFCEPGVATCPIPAMCGAPEAAPVAAPARPINYERWAGEFAKVRAEMLEMLRAMPARPDNGYKVEAAKWHARLRLAHNLLLDLRPLATDELRLRIDQELSRE